MCLQRTSTKRRILFVAPDLMAHGLTGLLGSVWELRVFQHTETHKVGSQRRLAKVWSKLQVWDLLEDEFEAAILLDTDIIVAGSMDACFNLVQHADIAGCFRGLGNFSLSPPRPACTIKTAKMVAKATGKGKPKYSLQEQLRSTLVASTVLCLRPSHVAAAMTPKTCSMPDQASMNLPHTSPHLVLLLSNQHTRFSDA